MKKLLKVIAIGVTALVSFASALLSLSALSAAFSKEIKWLHHHFSDEVAAIVGGILLGLGIALLVLEAYHRNQKPRKAVAGVAVLWVLSSLGLILFPLTDSGPREEPIVKPKVAPLHKKTHKKFAHHDSQQPDNKGQAVAIEKPSASQSNTSEVDYSPNEGTSNASSATKSTSPEKSGCTCSGTSPANPSPAPPTKPTEDTSNFAQSVAEEEAGEAAEVDREEEREAAEEAQEEAEEAREEAELGI